MNAAPHEENTAYLKQQSAEVQVQRVTPPLTLQYLYKRLLLSRKIATTLEKKAQEAETLEDKKKLSKLAAAQRNVVAEWKRVIELFKQEQ
jgi:hypothetical protein